MNRKFYIAVLFVAFGLILLNSCKTRKGCDGMNTTKDEIKTYKKKI